MKLTAQMPKLTNLTLKTFGEVPSTFLSELSNLRIERVTTLTIGLPVLQQIGKFVNILSFIPNLKTLTMKGVTTKGDNLENIIQLLRPRSS